LPAPTEVRAEKYKKVSLSYLVIQETRVSTQGGAVEQGKVDGGSPLLTVGIQLKKAREKKRWSVKKLSDLTKVSARQIENIERGEFYRIPSRTLVLGFTKSVCEALNVDPKPIFVVLKDELYDGQEIDFYEIKEKKKSGIFEKLKTIFQK